MEWEYLFGHVKRSQELLTVTESVNAERELSVQNGSGGIPLLEFAEIAGNLGWEMVDFCLTGNLIPNNPTDLVVFKRKKNKTVFEIPD